MDLEAWGLTRRVLCVRLDGMGDVLMTTPAIRAVKGTGRRHVTLLTSPSGAEVAELIPEVDEVIVYEAPWMKGTAHRQHSGADRAMVDTLRASRFDGAVVFTVYSQNPLPAAMACYLAEIPLRLAHCRENPYQLLTDWVPDPEPERTIRHEVRRQLDLVATVGMTVKDQSMAVRVPAAARRRVAERLSGLGLTGRDRWVVIHPGATAESRRYPAKQFAAAARRLVLEAGCDVVFTGSAAEARLVEAVRSDMDAPSRSVAGQLDVAGLAALLQAAPLLIGNNSGPVHLAAAVGTPVVDLYALTNPQHTPWGVPNRVLFHDVPCRYCYKSVCPEGHHDCLRRVPADAVFVAACELLEGNALAGSFRSPPA
jgi:lipopolysaccharide heptosyltransferase II